MAVSVQLAQQVEHFGGNIFIYSALIHGAERLGHMAIFLGGTLAA